MEQEKEVEMEEENETSPMIEQEEIIEESKIRKYLPLVFRILCVSIFVLVLIFTIIFRHQVLSILNVNFYINNRIY